MTARRLASDASPGKSKYPKGWRREQRNFLNPFKREPFLLEILKAFDTDDFDDLNDPDLERVCEEVRKKICRDRAARGK